MATGWCDQPAVPALAAALDPAITRSCRPATGTPAGCPTAACSSSGRRRPACSSPTSWRTPARRRAGRRPPQPAAAALPRHGHLLVARPHREPRPDHRRDGRPGRRPPRAVAAARRPARPRRPRPGHAAGQPASSWPAASSAVDGADVRFADDLPSTVAAADERHAPARSADIDAHIDATGLAAEVLDPEPTPSRPVGGAPTSSTCGRGASRPSSGPPATGGATRGCRARARRRRRDPPAPRRHARARACTCSASASSTAAAPTSSTASAATRSTSPTT